MLEMFTDADPMRAADYRMPADGAFRPGHDGGGAARILGTTAKIHGASRIFSALSAAVRSGNERHGVSYLRLLRRHEQNPMSAEEVTDATWAIALTEPYSWAQ